MKNKYKKLKNKIAINEKCKNIDNDFERNHYSKTATGFLFKKMTR